MINQDDGLCTRLKLASLVILYAICGNLIHCIAWGKSVSNNHHTLYSSQKEKTSIARRHQYRKTTYSTQSETFWDNLRKDFTLIHHTHQSTVQAQINHFLQRPYQLCHTIHRSAPYIHYIYEQVKKRHLPGELVLLPLIESTYNPSAINPTSGASGLWQLTPRTAQKFGARQDAIFDGKQDLYISTHTALDYLTYLNQLFCGNWLLTLAAYDTGEGNVKRAVHYNAIRQRNTKFWDLPLSSETVSYVPKLLALSAIIKNPKKYKLELPVINKRPYLVSIEVPAGISPIYAASLANISLKELKRFNSGFKQLGFVPKQSYRLLLPIAYFTTFKRNLAHIPLQTLRLRLSYYKTKPGDTLSSIAKHHRITVNQLCIWNGLIRNQILPINKNLVIIKLPFIDGLPKKYNSATT